MDQPSNIPRRAWQRRNLRRDAANNTSDRISKPQPATPRAARRNYQGASAQERGDETDSSFSPGFSSDSESDGELSDCGQLPRRAAFTVRSYKRQNRADTSSDSEPDSCSDSDVDSGYGSLVDDSDKTANFYDHLLARFETEGPALADHSDNTKRMIREQEEKWNK